MENQNSERLMRPVLKPNQSLESELEKLRFSGFQAGFLADRRQEEVWWGGFEWRVGVVFFRGWGGSICPALLTACLRSPSSRLQASFFFSKQAEYFLGAPSGWVLVKPGVRGQSAAEGRAKALMMCVCVCVILV